KEDAADTRELASRQRRKASIKRVTTYECSVRTLQGARQTTNFCRDWYRLSKLATALFFVLHAPSGSICLLCQALQALHGIRRA
ncbi:unnamed protein product, partial [Laminaria digitata]